MHILVGNMPSGPGDGEGWHLGVWLSIGQLPGPWIFTKKEPPSERTGQTSWDLELMDCQCLPISLGLDEGMCHPWGKYDIDKDLLCLVFPHPTFLFFCPRTSCPSSVSLGYSCVPPHLGHIASPTPNNKAFTHTDVHLSLSHPVPAPSLYPFDEHPLIFSSIYPVTHQPTFTRPHHIA